MSNKVKRVIFIFLAGLITIISMSKIEIEKGDVRVKTQAELKSFLTFWESEEAEVNE